MLFIIHLLIGHSFETVMCLVLKTRKERSRLAPLFECTRQIVGERVALVRASGVLHDPYYPGRSLFAYFWFI
jgi:hypothetical protein